MDAWQMHLAGLYASKMCIWMALREFLHAAPVRTWGKSPIVQNASRGGLTHQIAD